MIAADRPLCLMADARSALNGVGLRARILACACDCDCPRRPGTGARETVFVVAPPIRTERCAVDGGAATVDMGGVGGGVAAVTEGVEVGGCGVVVVVVEVVEVEVVVGVVPG